jgi:hypothetical protein
VIRLFIQQKIKDELSSVVATQVASLRQVAGSNARGLPESNGGARVTSNSRAVCAPSATSNHNLGPGGVITGALP